MTLYTLHADGSATPHAEFQNAFRGAMLIWQWMIKRYMPGIKNPSMLIMGCATGGDDKKFWGLAKRQDINPHHRIAFASTFDRVVVGRDKMPALIEAFQSFCDACEDPGHFAAQIPVLKKLLEDPDITGVAWNQTSVCGDPLWDGTWDYNEETEEDEHIPFNLEESNKWWCLFDVESIVGSELLRVRDSEESQEA